MNQPGSTKLRAGINAAIQDVIDGAKNHEFWMTFGMNDIKAKYRRSKLGQWWITLSVAIFIFVIGTLYRGIFNANSGTYLAYLAIGYITWLFIQDSVNQGCMVIRGAKPFMMQKSWPISTFVYRLVYRELLILAHHAILLPPIFMWLKLWPGFGGVFYAFLGLALTVITAFWVILLLTIISLRFPDIPPIINSLMRMAFFATPIIWLHRDLGKVGDLVMLLNPFGYFIKIVRDPLLGNGLPLSAWGGALTLSLITTCIALLALSLTKEKLSYWL